ncbi:SusC/RagA family TonB-linked outer membrane protein [Fodinibius sp. SL11]|uniref:SusC/RagA family TonB-linked outer membrane protein n=1 Tax=Fodinibius sp. SL11 TaxID=3425690 RepID=UPI003F881147
MVLFRGQVKAQDSDTNHTVTGVVIDADNGNSLPGVNISVKGTTRGTATDSEGFYQLTTPSETDTLVFSFIGYATLEIPIEGRSEVNVELSSRALTGEEIVVTGYGVERRDELTGSISSVNPEDIADISTHNPLQSLQGRVSGLNITRDGTPGGGTQQVLIRGISTLGDNEPLYIIDGQPVERRRFDLLSSNEIESIQVLKDASAASIYGSRASNGVIIVTTKKGQSDQLRLEFNTRTTFESQYPTVDVMNTEQRGRAAWRASVNDGADPNDQVHYDYDWQMQDGQPVLNNIQTVEWLDQNVQGGIRASDTDWFDVITRNGLSTENNISLSTGGENYSLMTAVGHNYQKGVVKFNDFERYTLRLNSSLDLLDGKLTIGENMQLARSEQTPFSDYVFGGNPLSTATLLHPIIPVYAEDGSFAGPIGGGLSDRLNPLATSSFQQDDQNEIRSVYGSLYADLSITDNLEFSTNFSVDYDEEVQVVTLEQFNIGFLSRDPNRLVQDNRKTSNWTWSNTLNYSFDLGEHSTEILAGVEANRSDTEFLSAERQDFLLETDNFWEFDAGSGPMSVSGTSTGFRLLSYFSKINYNYSNRYLATATFRYDGSSRFGEDKRFGFFPAFSLGWRITNENFFRNSDSFDFISDLKLRVGAGRMGNQRIDDNAPFAFFTPAYGTAEFLCCGAFGRPTGTAYALGGQQTGELPSGIKQVQRANPNLNWEETDEVNVGLDFGLFDQQLTGSFDYFIRETRDILVLPPRLAVLGEGSDRWENGATMENRGWEVSLTYDDVIGELGYSFTTSLSSSKDEITFVPESVVRDFPGNVEKTIVGRSITANFGYVADGIFQNEQEVQAHADQPGKGVGRLRFKDLNNDGTINSLDQDWLGNELPDLQYGLQGNFSYKQFRLSFYLQGVYGVERFNPVKPRLFYGVGTNSGENLLTRALDAWTPENPDSDIPALSLDNANNEARMSSFMIEDMSYVKLRNLRLEYTLPSALQESLGLTNARVHVSGGELFTISSSDFTGGDPENPGSFYPLPRTFTFGFNLAF